MHDNQSFEDDGPCCVAETALEGPENLRNPGFPRVRRDKDVFDVLGLGRGELGVVSRGELMMMQAVSYLDLGCALDGFLPARSHLDRLGSRYE